MSMPSFYGNKVGDALIVVRKTDESSGTRPRDVLGEGTIVIEAPCSERARSMLGIRRAKAGLS
jgi:hypothetical protein